MNGRPKSVIAMTKAVAFAKCPWAEPLSRKQKFAWMAYKSILKSIALYSDQNTGGNAYVSNAMLIEATNLSERFIRYAMKDLEFGIKLITCTGQRKGGRAGRKGKGLAPIWRIELSNPAFPDKTPTGEWLIEGGMDPDEGGTESVSRGHQQPLKGAPSTDEGGTNSACRGHVGATQSEDSPPPPPPPIPTPAAQNTGWEGWLTSKTATMGAYTKRDRHELEKLVSEHGLAVVKEIVRQFENRDKGFTGVKLPWILFFNEAPALIPAAKEAVWKASPEYAERMKWSERQYFLLGSADFGRFQPFRGLSDTSEEERAVIQKVDANKKKWETGLCINSPLFLTKNEIEILLAMRARADALEKTRQKEEEARRRAEPDEILI